MGNIFNEDFRDFIRALNNNNVAYLLVGGYSVILHGYSRTTGDMDIWVKRDMENYKKLVNAFLEFKMPVFEMTEDNFLNHDAWDVFRFGKRPSAIDIMVKVKGLNFDECYKDVQSFDYEGLNIKTINFNHLLQAKKASHRPKDIDDIENLNKK
jgi:hypothetical protein